jgi:hypothetical protein
MCVDDVKSKYQLLNKCKLLFDLVAHQQQHSHCFMQHSNSLDKFDGNFTKHNFYFVTHFMSKRNFYFETEGVHNQRLVLPFIDLDLLTISYLSRV